MCDNFEIQYHSQYLGQISRQINLSPGRKNPRADGLNEGLMLETSAPLPLKGGNLTLIDFPMTKG